jgi:bacillithiol biosynthesis cysteine-adding enzyme BshC
MKFDTLSFANSGIFSKIDTAYAQDDAFLLSLVQYPPTLDGLKASIAIRKTYYTDRIILTNTISKQYEDLKIKSEIVHEQIQKLEQQDTFTVITAHQPVLFTGPIYFIYKALSAIKLSMLLNEHQTHKIIPVFVIGGEDHDKEEINHLHIFNKKIVWETAQKGACGRFAIDDLEHVVQDLFQILGESTNALRLKQMIELAFSPGRTYAQATMSFLHQLLGKFGLLVVNMDEVSFKDKFKEIITDEILQHTSKNIIEKTQIKIQDAGYKPATYLRDINLFYLIDDHRVRIEIDGDCYIIQELNKRLTKEELILEIEQYPERFSPNVNMRPLFQELIFPNIAYIGGGGELAYWMERKQHFEHYGIPFPVLVRRDSAIWIDKNTSGKLEKLQLDVIDFMGDLELLINKFLEQNTDQQLDIAPEKDKIEVTLLQIVDKAQKIDPTLKGAFEAESIKILKMIESLGSRIVRAEKQKQDIHIKQIRQVKEKLFPNNVLQERHDNFIQLYLHYGDDLFEILLNQSDPLRKVLKIIRDEG